MPNEGPKDPPLKCQKCFGKKLTLPTTDSIIKAKKINLSFLLDYYNQMKAKHEKFFLDNNFIDKLSGSNQLREQINSGKNEDEIRELWKDGLYKFKLIREKYLIYK